MLWFQEIAQLTLFMRLVFAWEEKRQIQNLLPLIFQDIQTNGPCDGTNIRMPYFSDKPDLEYKAHLSFSATDIMFK